MIYVSKVSKLIIMCILTDTDTNKGTGKAQEHEPAGQHQWQAPNDEQPPTCPPSLQTTLCQDTPRTSHTQMTNDQVDDKG